MVQFLLIGLFILQSPTPADWHLEKNASGIQVYTRSIEGSAFKEFRGITIIPGATVSAVIHVILDVKNYTYLFPDCMNPRILKQEGPWYDIHYIQTKGPFPVKDREGVFEQGAVMDKNGKRARVTVKAIAGYIEENKEMVRIQKGAGFWEVEEDDKKNVKVTYQFHAEPGGDIPAWIANSFVVTQPFQTLKNLKERL